MGRVLRSSNPYKVDAADNPVETVYWTTPEYDDLSRTKKVISPDTDDVQIAYGLSTNSVIGSSKTVTDQAGKKRTGITDALGNMVRVIEDPEGNALTTDYVFDTLGNLRRTIQGEQNRYFMYDSLGRVLFAKQPEQDTNAAFVATDLITGNTNWSVKYSYDDNGNILTTTDARNISITGTYDGYNRLLMRDYSDSTPDVNFYYDGTGVGGVPVFSKGKTTKISSTVSESRNKSFDQMGRLLASEQRTTAEQLAGTQAPYNFSYVYNLSGALIEETYPSGRVVRNTLNSDGELLQVQSKKNAAQGFFTYADSFAYNPSGAVTRMQLGNGHWETAEYDPKRLQVTKIGLGLTSADENLFRLEFQYNSDAQTDNNGSLRLQRIVVPAAGGNAAFTATQSYFYDSLNRIESAVETVSGNQTWKQTFSYDRYGNRRFDAAGTTTLGTCPQAVCNPAISTSNNRLAPGQNYMYDAAGSVTRDAAGQRFGYDAENHQKEFFAASNQTTTPDATYQYDGEGKRVKKVVGNEVTVFVYDASGQLAAEYSTTVTPAAQATVGYLTTDHLGSPRIITDQYGRVSSRKDFTAFGDEIVTPQRVAGPNGNGYDPPTVRQDYTGYQKDGESGLEFAQARYYNAGHGRFTSVDPMTGSATIRNPQTLNRYSYVLNSPYKFTDPLGLAPGGCGAERSSCDGDSDDGIGSDHIRGALVAHDKRVNDTRIALKINPRKLNTKNAILDAIISEGGNLDDFEIQDQNPGSVTVEAEVGDDAAVAAASLPTDTVDLERNGSIVEEGVKINLPGAVTDALGEAAIDLANLGIVLGEQYLAAATAAHTLAMAGAGYTLAPAGPRLVLIVTDPTVTWDVNLGPFGLSKKGSILSNVMSLVEEHNKTVDQIQNKFIEGKSTFQKRFQNMKTTRVGGSRRNINLPSAYLGNLYHNRLQTLALF